MANATITTKSVADLRLELAAAEKVLHEKERAEQEKAREAERAVIKMKQDAEEQALREKMITALRPVFEALRTANIPAKWEGQTIVTGLHDTTISVEREEHRTSAYRSTYTGRLTIVVGKRYSRARPVRYRQGPTGHNVAKIVLMVQERLSARAAAVEREQKHEAKTVSAEQFAANLRKHFGVTDSVITHSIGHRVQMSRNCTEWHEYPAAAGYVYVKVGNPMLTPEQARIMVKALQAIKALEPKRDSDAK